jgi:hypothetical protein
MSSNCLRLRTGLIQAVLRCCLLTSVITGVVWQTVSSARAQDKPLQNVQSNSGTATDKDVQPLGMWKECVGTDSARLATQMCDAPRIGINYVAGSVLSSIVSEEVTHLGFLCCVEATIRNTQDVCLPEGELVDKYGYLPDMVFYLALSWWQRGTLERADQLFSYALQLTAINPGNDPTFMVIIREVEILRQHAALKFVMGDRDAAKAFAIQQTDLSRKGASTAGYGRKVALSSLRGALMFQAALYDDLGLASEAQALRAEADALMPTIP